MAEPRQHYVPSDDLDKQMDQREYINALNKGLPLLHMSIDVFSLVRLFVEVVARDVVLT